MKWDNNNTSARMSKLDVTSFAMDDVTLRKPPMLQEAATSYYQFYNLMRIVNKYFKRAGL
jgi:hypothetical protein